MNGQRIIIVEDEKITSEYIKSLLEAGGYQVKGTYTSGEETLERFDIDQPDLAIMDINLSGDMSGIETAKLIKERRDIPIIYLTAVSNLTIISNADKTGHSGFLIKPVRPDDLNMTVSSAIARYCS